MRKKVKTLVVFVMVIAMFALTFAGCTLIKKNEVREANESLATINKNGITLEISKNAFLDYFNTLYAQNAQYIQNGYFSLDQILDAAIEGKIKNTYLLADAMVYLTDKKQVGDARYNALVGKGAKVKLEDVLTYAEWAEAVYSVNKSIDDQIDAAKENAYQTKLDKEWRKVEKAGVKEIEFTKETKEYLKDIYYENYEIDFDKIKVVVVYDELIEKDGVKENKRSEDLIPSRGSYTKEFTTKFGDQESGDEVKKTFEITFNGLAEGDKEAPTFTVSHEYTLKKARVTKNKKDELEGVLDKLKINDIIVGRYDSKEQLKEKDIDLDGTDEKYRVYKIRDLEKEAEELRKTSKDEDLIEGYRVVTERMKASYKDMEYYYYSAFEMAVSNALKNEIYQQALNSVSAEDLEKEVVTQLKYLLEKGKVKYGTDAEKNKEDFKKAITENVKTAYYYPAMDDTNENFYVYNLLFKFSPDDEKFLSDIAGDKDVLNGYREYIKGKTVTFASNPNYDKEHECPLHKDAKTGESLNDKDKEIVGVVNEETEEKCSFSGDLEGIKDGKICPSVKYGRIEDGKLKILGVDDDYEEKVEDVIARLQNELVEVKNDATLTTEEISKKSIEIFERYMYSYNDDGGIMNNTLGYYGTNESFQKEFLDLSKEVWAFDPIVGNAFSSDEKLGLGYSSYGIHIVMISATPFSGAVPNKELSFENDEELIEYYKKEYDVEGNSIYKDVEKSRKDQIKTQAYLNYTNKHVPTKFITRDEKKNKVSLEKELKDEVKINNKKLKGIFDLFLKS